MTENKMNKKSLLYNCDKRFIKNFKKVFEK